MNKTKCGVSVGLAGAFFCFLAAFSSVTYWPLLAVAAFILLKEDNDWLKRLVLKVIIILIGLTILTYAIGWISSIVSIISCLADDSSITIPRALDSHLCTLIGIAQEVVLFILGFKSLKQKFVKIDYVDDIINSNV